MARNESDREDMIREATALRNRVEWKVPDESELVFAGVKSNGWLALYFGTDPVYQFSEEGGLRRAFVEGYLYRTQGDTLARLHRARSETTTSLIRRDLTTDETAKLLDQMDGRLRNLILHISDGSAEVVRSVATDDKPDFVALIDRALNCSSRLAPAIAHRAH